MDHDAIRAASKALKDQLRESGPESFEEKPTAAADEAVADKTDKERAVNEETSAMASVFADAGEEEDTSSIRVASAASDPDASTEGSSDDSDDSPNIFADAGEEEEDEPAPATRAAVPARIRASASPPKEAAAKEEPPPDRNIFDVDDDEEPGPVLQPAPRKAPPPAEKTRPVSLAPATTRATPSPRPAAAAHRNEPTAEEVPTGTPEAHAAPVFDFDAELRGWRKDGLDRKKAESYGDNAFLERSLTSLSRLIRLSTNAEQERTYRSYHAAISAVLNDRGIKAPKPPEAKAPKSGPPASAAPRPALVPPAPVSTSMPAVIRPPTAPKPPEPLSIEIAVSEPPPRAPEPATELAPASILTAPPPASSGAPSLAADPNVLAGPPSASVSLNERVELAIAEWLSGDALTQDKARTIADLPFLVALHGHLAGLETSGVSPDLNETFVSMRRVLTIELCARGAGGLVFRDKDATAYVEWLRKALPGQIDLESDAGRKSNLRHAFEELQAEHDRASRINEDLARIVKEGSKPSRPPPGGVAPAASAATNERMARIVQAAAFIALVAATIALFVWGYLPRTTPEPRTVPTPTGAAHTPGGSNCRMVDKAALAKTGVAIDCSSGTETYVDGAKWWLCDCTFK